MDLQDGVCRKGWKKDGVNKDVFSSYLKELKTCA